MILGIIIGGLALYYYSAPLLFLAGLCFLFMLMIRL